MPKHFSEPDLPLSGLDGAGPAGRPGIEAPAIGLPKGGGAIRGLDAVFAAAGATGGAGMRVALPLPADRTGAPPAVGLVYTTQGANGPFGRGWALTIPAITRKVSQGIPRYFPGAQEDTYLLDGSELVPSFTSTDNGYAPDIVEEDGFRYERFRPRLLSTFSRIERITRLADGDVHWRVVTANNLTQRFGFDASARIADPESQHRVFSWLLSETFDDRGNAVLYRWKAEDGDGLSDVYEATRRGAFTYAQKYPKRIFYGNATPRVENENLAARTDWLFEIAFDYGEHVDDNPNETQNWALRKDPVSDCRAGFEIRTWRLAQRVLVFHRFPELGPDPLLTRALILRYRSLRGVADDAVRGAPDGAFLTAITEHGYGPDNAGIFERIASPTLTFDYALPVFSGTVQDLPEDAIENWPDGSDGATMGFFDLRGEGLPGLLTGEGGAWRYSPNRGGRFESVSLVDPRPVPAPGKDSRDILVDVTGDGPLSLVSLRPERAGYFRQDLSGDWDGLKPFEAVPRIDWSDPNLRLMDVTGTGNLDVVIARGDGVTWFAGRGEEGFASGVFVAFPTPSRWVFDRGDSDLLTADMTGDGLPDLVRIGSEGITYRQNLGFGRFGPEIVMATPPTLRGSGGFDLRRVRLADLDGDGAADLVHIGDDRVTLYLNRAGNSWHGPIVLSGLSGIADSDRVDVVDLFGTDTPCIVWSRATPGTAPVRLRYADLLGGRKPHLMTRFENGIGKRVEMDYTPSTRFYLDDLAAGNPWIGRLGFVLHCITRVTTRDLIRETVLVSTYSYHHGFYDGKEREFRGFGRVDQRDAETVAAPAPDPLSGAIDDHVITQPPVLTRRWTHTGVISGHQLVPADFSSEYWVNPLLPEWPVSPIVLPHALSPDERADAIRALAGAPLRQEIHGEDGGPPVPYVTGRQSYSVRRVQPAMNGRPAVFQLLPDETIAHAYDRIADDPRIEQQLTLARDDLGLPILAATIAYGRTKFDTNLPPEVQTAQATRMIRVVETGYTGDVIGGNAANPVHRLRTLFESRTYDLTGLSPGMLTRMQVATQLAAAAPLAFEAPPAAGARKRLLSRTRALFLKDDLSGALPAGQLGARGLPHETYTLAFTDGLIAAIYSARVDAAMLAAAGYVQLAGEDGWWVPSGRPLFDGGAPGRFFLPLAVQGAMGAITRIGYDAHAFMAISATDPLNNTISAAIDYRTLSAAAITDANGLVNEVRTDALGRVTRMAMRGPNGEGTTLDDPSAFYEYDHLAFEREGKPAMARTREREHFGAGTRWLESRSYTDGSGGTVMAKIMAPGGLAKEVQPDGSVIEVDTGSAPRWIGNGRTIIDNKGNAIRRYQPYYSTSADFEMAHALVQTGAVSNATYDPLGRLIRLDLPDGRYERVEIGPWASISHDAMDTVLDSRWYAERGSPAPASPEPADPQTRAAWLSAQHANTPAQLHFDALGRVLFSIADNGAEGRVTARFAYEAGNRITRSFDALDRLVAISWVNLAGKTIMAESAERGERRIFSDCEGRDTHVWDRSGLSRSVFDVAGRPVSGFHQPPIGPEVRHTHAVYGDALAVPQAGALGRLVRLYDTAGVTTMAAFEWRGLPVRIERRLASNPETVPDWQVIGNARDPAIVAALAEPLLDTETFVSTARFDALGRPESMVLPDSSIITPSYDIATRLASISGAIGAGATTPFLTSVGYDATGQRQEMTFGNGIVTRYRHDFTTGRLDRLITLKAAGDPETAALQALSYVYDASGNPVEIADDAQQTHYFDNAVVSATRRFAYDAIGRLIAASGREHAAIGAMQPANDDLAAVRMPHANDASAVRRYSETYAYDVLGNLLSLRHVAGPAQWTRRYRYATAISGNRTNRLLATSLPGDAPGIFSAQYASDVEGRMTAMPHLAALDYDVRDRLMRVDLGGGGTAHFTYAAGGSRIRKVVRRPGGISEERLYLGPLQCFRRRRRGVLVLERWTVTVSDGVGVIAEVDRKTIDTLGADNAPLAVAVPRYRHGDLIGSASLETGQAGDQLAYEEYHPFGTSAYRAFRPGAIVSLKRYRFAGKERDDETGLQWFGVRCYAPWLGRWTMPDPAGFKDGANLYAYCRNNPVGWVDPDGRQSARTDNQQSFEIPRTVGAAGPAAVAQYLRDRGFDFTGPVRQRADGTYDVGDWLRIPGQSPSNPPPGSGAATPPAAPPVEAGGSGGLPSGSGGAANDNVPPSGAQDGGSARGPGGGEAANDNEPADASAVAAAGGGLVPLGGELARRNPTGFTLVVPNSYDGQKMGAYREGVYNREVGINPNRTRAQRQAGRGASRQFRAANPQPAAPAPGGRGYNADHIIELQHDLTGRSGLQPDHYRWQDASLNQLEGSQSYQLRGNNPTGTPAGGIAREADAARFWNQPGFRTGMRGLGYVAMVLGPAATIFGATQVDSAPVAGATYTAGAVEAGAVGYYFYGNFALGAATPAGMAALTTARLVGGVAGGVGTAVLSGYQSYQEFKAGDYVAGTVDAAAAIGGVAIAVGCIVGAPVAIAVGIGLGLFAAGFHIGRWLASR